MIRNHLLIAFRVLKRGKVFSLINLGGMTLGLTIALMIMLYVRFELSYESYNPTADTMVRVTMDYLDGETVVDQDCETYPPLGPLINNQIPEVTDFVRTYHIDPQTFRVGDEFYREAGIYAVDPQFFDLFHYPLKAGKREGLFVGPHEMVLTESTAMKYFGKTDVVGEQLYYADLDLPFIVRGVIEDCPPNTHLKFNLLVSFETLLTSFGETEDNWNGNNTFTYLNLRSEADIPVFEEKLLALNEKLKAQELIESENVIAQPMTDIHLYSHKSFEAEQNGDATSVFFLFGVAILIIVISIVNYINLATSRSLDRAKEVGIRKVLGSSLGQLRLQFFMESMLLNLGAGTLAVGLVALTAPQFRILAGLPEDFSMLGQPWFWIILGAVVLISTIFSGIFPAFILSSFQPVTVLKGKFGHSALGVMLRKGLVVFQFGVTIFLLSQTLTSFRQLSFLRDLDLGVDISQTIVVRAPGEEALEARYATFRDQVLAYPEFESVALSSCVPGMSTHDLSTTTGIQWVGAVEERNFNFYIYFIDADFLNTMKMELLAGNNFLQDSENENVVLVNEEAVRLWGIGSNEEAVGQEIDMWGGKRRIGGVVKNFHQAGAKDDFIPMIFWYGGPYGELASIRTLPGNTREQLAQVEELYGSVFPGAPFDYFFMDQEYDKQYREDERFQNVFGTLTGLAIFIACFGLFGLVAFSVTKRSKEIGIRKILGAGVSQIITLFSKDFLQLILIAAAISIPLTWLVIRNWLERYAFRIDLDASLFVIPAVIVFLLAAVTIFSRTFGISTQSPVDAIQEE